MTAVCVMVRKTEFLWGMDFKTRVFGGFDREDVISFIEKTSLEHQKRVSALEEENKRLSDRCGAAEAEVQALREQSRAELAAAAELEELKRKFAALTAENEQLRGENEQLRGPAEEYRRMKDHIADIEISAHRRTEEFRAQAIAELREMIVRQETWCAQAQAQYQQLSEQFAQKLELARRTVSAPDLSSFEQMREGLAALSGSFDEQAEA